MPLPQFGAEASLARSRGHYQGAYRYGARPGGIQPNQLYTGEADELAFTDMADPTNAEEIAEVEADFNDETEVGESIALADDTEIELDAHELALEGDATEVEA